MFSEFCSGLQAQLTWGKLIPRVMGSIKTKKYTGQQTAIGSGKGQKSPFIYLLLHLAYKLPYPEQMWALGGLQHKYSHKYQKAEQ